MTTFGKQVKVFTEKAKRASTLMHKTALTQLTETVERETPKDTGNAFRSWLGSTDSMPAIRPDVETFPQHSQTSIAILGSKLGDTFFFGAQAAYMPRLEYGFTGTDARGRSYNQTGKGWIAKNAALWPAYVKQAERLHKVT